MLYNYNLHDFINITLSQEKINLKTEYDYHFSQLKFERTNCDYNYNILEFNKFKLPDEHFNIHNKFYGFKNGLADIEKEYAVIFNGKNVTEYTNHYNQTINFLIQLLLVNQNMSLVHSAGIELNGKSYIIPSFEGAGKTTLISKLRQDKSFKLYGDDYVIISKNANMLSYHMDMSIYNHHIEIFPELKNTLYDKYLQKEQRIEFILNKIFGKNSLRIKQLYFKIWDRMTLNKYQKKWRSNYIKVPVSILFNDEQLGRRTTLSGALFLSRYSGENLKIESITAEKIADEIYGILSLELSNALNYCFRLSGFGEFNLIDFQKKQYDIIKSCFKKIPCYRILIPAKTTPGMLNDFILNILQTKV